MMPSRMKELDELADRRLEELRKEIGLHDADIAMVLASMFQGLDDEEVPDWMMGVQKDE